MKPGTPGSRAGQDSSIQAGEADESRLSAQDASFVYAETAAAPLAVGLLGWFEDCGQTAATVRTHLAGRLHRAPQLRQKLAFVPYELDLPRWVDDEAFDLEAHVRDVRLSGKRDEAAARKLMTQFMSAPLLRSRPLWQIRIFPMCEGRLGMAMKIHHCLLDGVSVAHLATVLFDASPDAAPSEPEPWTPKPPPAPSTLLGAAWRRHRARAGELATRARAWRPDAEQARTLLGQARATARSIADLARGALVADHRASLAGTVSARRCFETASLSMSEVKALKNREGCKLNDVALAVVAGGLGELLDARGVDTQGATVKALVPVSKRVGAGGGGMGNQVSMMAVDLPVGVDRAPAEQLGAIAELMKRAKSSGQSAGADFWVSLAEQLPAQLVALVSNVARLPRVIDLVVTNVAGPPFPLYLAGGKLLEVYPFVPLFGATTLGVAVVSYSGRLYFGVSGDRAQLPDLDVLGRGLLATFDDLTQAPDQGADPVRAAQADAEI